tara:strand:- start:692 stop:874 length:183 start_codon:yes stop_codon:yes gene_type:complete
MVPPLPRETHLRRDRVNSSSPRAAPRPTAGRETRAKSFGEWTLFGRFGRREPLLPPVNFV